MKVLQLFSIMLLFVPVFSHAQDSTGVQAPHARFLQSNLELGYLKNDISKINQALMPYDLEVAEGIRMLTLSSSFFSRRFFYSASFSRYLNDFKGQPGQRRTSLNGTAGGLSIGYTVLNKKNIRMYPYMGANVNFTAVKIKDMSPVTSLDDVLKSPRRDVTLDFTNITLDLGIHAEKLINIKNRKWDCPQNARYFAVGIKAGYLFKLYNSSEEQYNFQTINGFSGSIMNGPYVKLTLGFGSKIRQLKWN